jgi:adenylate kinase family enzyme
MNRVVIVGPGGSGKSTLAVRLGHTTGLPVIELDKVFWQPDRTPMPSHQWIAIQEKMAEESAWILDGDLGPYDVAQPRLLAADTIIVLDLSPWKWLWRAADGQGSEPTSGAGRLMWRRQSRPALLKALAETGSAADVHIFRSARAVEIFIAGIEGLG